MQSHRIRLNDLEVDLIVAALNARIAMTKGQRRSDMMRLAERLADGGKGNPDWRFGSAHLVEKHGTIGA
jgi:hypothetical protein